MVAACSHSATVTNSVDRSLRPPIVAKVTSIEILPLSAPQWRAHVRFCNASDQRTAFVEYTVSWPDRGGSRATESLRVRIEEQKLNPRECCSRSVTLPIVDATAPDLVEQSMNVTVPQQ